MPGPLLLAWMYLSPAGYYACCARCQAWIMIFLCVLGGALGIGPSRGRVGFPYLVKECSEVIIGFPPLLGASDGAGDEGLSNPALPMGFGVCYHPWPGDVYVDAVGFALSVLIQVDADLRAAGLRRLFHLRQGERAEATAFWQALSARMAPQTQSASPANWG